MAEVAARRLRNAVRDLVYSRFPHARKVKQRLRNMAIDAIVTAFPAKYIGRYVLPEDEAAAGGGVRNLRVMLPGERIRIGRGDEDPFARVAQAYNDGWFDRPDVFVCEIPDAYVHVRSGMVCTSDFKLIADKGMEHRRYLYPPFRGRRPESVPRAEGLWTTLAYCNSENFWHWMIDCLPKIRTLEIALAGEPLIICMHSMALPFQRFTLEAVLPPNFRLVYLDPETSPWIRPERFIWASMVSGLCMGVLPKEYYDAIRGPVFERLGLPATHVKTERLYISRRNAGHRRVRNEDAVVELLAGYGFRSVQLEKLPFEEQVKLFHRAEVVVGPHGAGLGTIFFSGDIDLVALYSTREPGNYFQSLACGLGQRHHFLCSDEAHEDDWFDVDLPALQDLLEDQVGLQRARGVS